MSININLHFNFFINAFASKLLSSELNFDGIMTVVTLSGPNASQARTAVKAESIPPDKPIIAVLKLFFLK